MAGKGKRYAAYVENYKYWIPSVLVPSVILLWDSLHAQEDFLRQIFPSLLIHPAEIHFLTEPFRFLLNVEEVTDLYWADQSWGQSFPV